MKKTFIFALILILFISLAKAQSFEIEIADKEQVIVSELNNAAVFNVTIINHDEQDEFEVYSLVIPITPSGKITVPAFGERTFEVRANPPEQFRKNIGFFTFEFEVAGKNSGKIKDNFLMKIVPFDEVIEITAQPISPEDSKAKIIISNKEQTSLNNLKVKLTSSFFEKEQTFHLKPKENVTIDVEINKETGRLTAGSYIIKAEIESNGETIKKQAVVEYLEREGTSISENTEGFIIRKTTLTKTNKGNTEITASLSLKKNIISRLFTLNSPSATEVERQGFSTTYSWESSLKPNESLVVESKTNYTIPLIILLLIIATAVGAKFYYFTPLSIKKRVSFVRTKGGEFALKVHIRVRANNHVDKVQLIDRLPAMTTLYDKIGRQPDKIDEHTRRLFWNINSLAKGEERAYSYVIYSKLKIVGQLTLPQASASFHHNNQAKHVLSNKAFFAVEN